MSNRTALNIVLPLSLCFSLSSSVFLPTAESIFWPLIKHKEHPRCNKLSLHLRQWKKPTATDLWNCSTHSLQSPLWFLSRSTRISSVLQSNTNSITTVITGIYERDRNTIFKFHANTTSIKWAKQTGSHVWYTIGIQSPRQPNEALTSPQWGGTVTAATTDEFQTPYNLLPICRTVSKTLAIQWIFWSQKKERKGHLHAADWPLHVAPLFAPFSALLIHCA